MSGKPSRHGVDREPHLGVAFAQEVDDLAHRMLRLRDGHPVARHDDHRLRLPQEFHHLVGRRRDHLPVHHRPAHRCGALLGTESAEDDRDERTVHRRAHDVAQDRARRSDQGAGDDQQVVGEHEARRRRCPSRVAVEHRDDHRHVGAPDRHHEMDADQARHRRDGEQRRQRLRSLAHEDHAEPEADEEHHEIEQVPPRE